MRSFDVWGCESLNASDEILGHEDASAALILGRTGRWDGTELDRPHRGTGYPRPLCSFVSPVFIRGHGHGRQEDRRFQRRSNLSGAVGCFFHNMCRMLLLVLLFMPSVLAGCAITPDANGHVDIPSSWTSISFQAFYLCVTMTSVTIPDGVSSIGQGAFYRCTSMTSVIIGDSVTSIGTNAFYQCTSLASVTIPDGVINIGGYAFYGCTSLASVTIGDSVTSIGDSVFRECMSLTSVTIPDSVTSIGTSAFGSCTSLASVTIPDSVTSIGVATFNRCTSLTSVTIPDNVTSINDATFKSCTSLISVTIPDSVTSIGKEAFEDCTSLTSVTIGDGVTSISEDAFKRCTSLTSVTIGDGVTSIGDGAFIWCTSLTSVTIPDSVTSIGSVFPYCTSLTSVTIPDSMTFIGHGAFAKCPVSSLTVTGSTNPGPATFASLLPTSQWFYPPAVTSITVDGTATHIRDKDFTTFTGIKKVTFEASANDAGLIIGSQAFENSCVLEEIYVKRSDMAIATDSFNFSCSRSTLEPVNFIKSIYDPGFTDIITCSSSDEKCGCAVPGIGSSLGENSPYFNCAASCEAGKYASGSAYDDGLCRPCPADTYSRVIGASACQPCTSDVSAEGACGDECPLGTHIINGTDCVYCEQGKYSDEEGLFDCKPCPLGKFSNTKGAVSSSTCVDCQAGRYSDIAAAIECQLCPTNTSTSGRTGSTDCLPCDAGRYSPEEGIPFCYPCAAGKYTTQGQSACLSCDDGLTTIKGEGLSHSECFKNCTVGEASMGSTTICTLCGSGTYNNMTGQKECTLCPVGRFIREQGKTDCEECAPGSYAETEASPVCALCPGGKFSSVLGSTNSSNCELCPKGSYSFFGMTECRLTPPGSYVDIVGANDWTPCAAGRYQPESGKRTCEQAQAGQYSGEGAAIPSRCDPGTYSTTVGAESADTCLDCPYGTYSQLGASACIECGQSLMSNEDHSGCVMNPDSLTQESLVSALFSNGAALYGTFIVAAGFVALASILSFKREKCPDSLSQLPRFQVLVKSFLPGFSFGSELFLIIGIVGTEPGVASVMIIFRLLHVVVGAIICTTLWYPSAVDGGRLEYVLQGASSLRYHLDEDFCRENVPFIGVLTLISFLDSTMVQFMPWKKNRFITESKGFPSLGLLKCVLRTKAIQGGASVICQVSFLLTSSELGGSTVSAQAKALFIMNILFSVTAVVLGLLLLGIKGELLSNIDNTTTDRSGSNSETTVDNSGRRQTSVFELADIHTSSDITTMDNPMYSIEEGVTLASAKERIKPLEMKAEEGSLEAENIALKDKNLKLEKENQSIKENCGDMEAHLVDCKAQLVDCKAQLANRDAEIESLKKQLQDKDYTPINEQTL